MPKIVRTVFVASALFLPVFPQIVAGQDASWLLSFRDKNTNQLVWDSRFSRCYRQVSLQPTFPFGETLRSIKPP